MNKKKYAIITVIVLALIIGIAGAPYISNIYHSIQTKRMLSEIFSRSELSLDIQVSGQISGQNVNMDLHVDKGVIDDREITCITYDKITFYIAEGAVFFENGKGYSIDDDILGLISMMKDAALAADISMSMVDDNDVMVLTLADKENGEFNLDVTLTVMNEAVEIQVPTEVVAAIEDGNYGNFKELTENLFRLITAWNSLENSSQVSGILNISGDCGIISLNEDFDISYTSEDEQKVFTVSKNGISIYFADGVMYDESGNVLLDNIGGSSASYDAMRLMTFIYEVCMEGDFECTEIEGRYLYSLALDEEAIDTLAYKMMPEAETMDVFFDGGSVVIAVENGSIQSVKVTCSGTLSILMIEEPVNLGAEIKVTA